MSCPEDKGHLNPIGLREIELNAAQMFVDDYLVENRYDKNMLSANVPHILHQPERPSKPLLSPDKPWERKHGFGHPGVVFDAKGRIFRMYYTIPQKERGRPGYPPGSYFMCYAESQDGINWVKPNLCMIPWGDQEDTNIIMQGDGEAKIAHVHVDNDITGDGQLPVAKNIGTIPAGFLREHRFVMFYCDHSHYLATSEDGIHWKEKVHSVISNRIDCYITIVYDGERQEFVSFLRNKLIFSGKGPEDRLGNTRMISRLAGRDLWSEWDTMPTSVLIPDQGDAKRFYGMPTFLYGGVYWGLLQHLDENPQTIEIELVFSRDGLNWERLAGHPKLIPVGKPGSWDCGMVSTADRVIEKGDEWWLYYTGYNGYHDAKERQGAIGLLKFRKEGFISLRAGENESYVLTRPLRWPGGHLVINASAREGFVKVRVTDQRRNTIEGLDYSNCTPFRGDQVRYQVSWRDGDIADQAGSIIRLEFKFRKADLFAFVAQGTEKK